MPEYKDPMLEFNRRFFEELGMDPDERLTEEQLMERVKPIDPYFLAQSVIKVYTTNPDGTELEGVKELGLICALKAKYGDGLNPKDYEMIENGYNMALGKLAERRRILGMAVTIELMKRGEIGLPKVD